MPADYLLCWLGDDFPFPNSTPAFDNCLALEFREFLAHVACKFRFPVIAVRSPLPCVPAVAYHHLVFLFWVFGQLALHGQFCPNLSREFDSKIDGSNNTRWGLQTISERCNFKYYL